MNGITKTKAFKQSVAAAALLLIAHAITWRFYPVCWFILPFADLILLVFYVAVTGNSLACWIRNRRDYKNPYLPFAINILAIALVIAAPSIDRNKNYYKGTVSLPPVRCNCRLYVESYLVYGGGALGSDIDALYLIDSLNFRLFIGTYDEEAGMITTICHGDKVTIDTRERTKEFFKEDTLIVNGKVTTIARLDYTLKTTDKKILSSKALKEQHRYQ